MDGIQGAVLAVKLKYLDQWNNQRRAHAALYDELLGQTEVVTPFVESYNVPVYHQYTIRATERDALQSFLTENRIGSAIFYPKALHLQDCFTDLGYGEGDFPITEKLCREVLSLPIYPELNGDQIRTVTRAIQTFTAKQTMEC